MHLPGRVMLRDKKYMEEMSENNDQHTPSLDISKGRGGPCLKPQECAVCHYVLHS